MIAARSSQLEKPATEIRRARRGDAGYTLLLALFVAAVMIIAASVAVPNLITQARRQKEKLMIWRGEQYERAIGLYYRKTGHFPHDLEELGKGANGLHFLRELYPDPMNSQDGSWRLIYLGKGGQLIGSLCWQTMVQYQAAQTGAPLLGSPPKGAATDAALPASEDLGAGNTQKVPTVPTCAMLGQSSSSSTHPQIITEGGMVGGNLIGVASQVNDPSIKDYMGADNYRYWEFIWNPQQGSQTTTPGAAAPAGLGGLGTAKTPAPTGAPNSRPVRPTSKQNGGQPQQP